MSDGYAPITMNEVPITPSFMSLVEQKTDADQYSIRVENNGLYIDRKETATSIPSPMGISDEKLLSIAVEDLKVRGLLPPDMEYAIYMDSVQQYIFDEQCEPISKTPDILEKTIYFTQQHNGRSVFSVDGNGITVRYDSKGLKSLFYKWYDIEDQPAIEAQLATSAKPLSEKIEEADTVFIAGTDEYDLLDEYYTAYAYLEENGVVRRTKVFMTDSGYTNPVYVDLDTQERIVK